MGSGDIAVAMAGDIAVAMAADIAAAMAGDFAAGFGLTIQATGSACRIRTRGLPAVLAVGTDSLGADRALETGAGHSVIAVQARLVIRARNPGAGVASVTPAEPAVGRCSPVYLATPRTGLPHLL